MTAIALQSQFFNYAFHEDNLGFDYSYFEQEENDPDEEFYDDPFNLPELEVPEKIIIPTSTTGSDKFPPVLNFIVFMFLAENDQKLGFMAEFGMRYLHYSGFREKVDGCCFLFLGGFYDSYHKTEQDALNNARERNYPGYKIHLSPMYITYIKGSYSRKR